MDTSEGLRIISTAKALEGFQRGDEKLSRYLGATILAGHVGLFLSSLRRHQSMKLSKFRALASAAHIDWPMLNTQIIPWMVKQGFIELGGSGDVRTVMCNVVDYQAILRGTAELFNSLDPTPEELAVLGLLDLGIQMPRTKTEVFKNGALGKDAVVERAVGLASAYRIVRVLEGEGIAEPVVYSPLIWGDNMAKAAKALSHMDTTKREQLLHLIERVQQYQGLPRHSAERWANKVGAPELVDQAVCLGLLDNTVIASSTGEKHFLTTPHLYGEIAVAHGRDVCDRIRLFLDSIRHGQHYGDWYTGRISDPVVLLNRLINRGQIGPCTAIGRDYQLVERAGVINVKPSLWKSGQFVMELAQEDTVMMVRDIVAQEPVAADMAPPSGSGTCDQDDFRSAEETRAQLGEPPQRVREAEMEMLRNLREM